MCPQKQRPLFTGVREVGLKERGRDGKVRRLHGLLGACRGRGTESRNAGGPKELKRPGTSGEIGTYTL